MNNMEIKQGDKVRVSSRVPRIYERFGSMIAPHYECKVVEIDDGMALLDSIPAKHIFLFPLKYLVKVDAKPNARKEREKQVFAIGERVCLDKYSGTCKHDGVVGTVCKITSISANDDKASSEWYYGIRVDGGKFPSSTSLSGFTDVLDGINACDLIPVKDTEPTAPKYKKGDRVKYVGKEHPEYWGEIFTVDGEIFYNDYHKNMQIDSVRCEKYNLCNVPLSDLEPYTDGATPTIKVGDRVRKGCLRGIVKEVAPGNVIVDLIDSDGKSLNIGLFDVWMIDSVESVEPTEQTETSADVLGSYTLIPMSANPIIGFEQEYWKKYTADLAKEVAVNNAKDNVDPIEIAEYAVELAKAVVEGLKRK